MSANDREQQIAPDYAVLVLDEPLRPREPAAPSRGLSHRKQSEAQPERRARGPHRLVRLAMCVVEALQACELLLVAPREPRRPREPLQILGIERGRAIRERQRLVSLRPRPLRVERAASLERAEHVALARL